MARQELYPCYDGKASFYGKAMVETVGEIKKLYSYGTYVASIIGDSAEVYDWYSATTGRHIKEFLKQNGFLAIGKAQILKDYGCEVKNGKE